MIKVLTAAQMREVDRLTTERYGIPSIILMENAAHAVARVITEKLGGSVKGKSILILCGKGNNGGDGAALARILGLCGAHVNVVLLSRIKESKGDARTNLGIICSEDFTYDDVFSSVFCELFEVTSKDEWNDKQLDLYDEADVIVDAIFGTGLTRPLDIWIYNIIHEMNFLGEAPLPRHRLRVAIDIPSGLNADTGQELDIAAEADLTVTFTSPKPGNVLPGASRFNGELLVADIGTPQELIDEQPSQLYLAERDDARGWMLSSSFSSDSYKNKRGHALVIAGSNDYSGAAVLAGNAAMRSGAGLVTLACPADAKAEIASRLLPEVILSTLDSSEFASHLERADAVAIGCGLDVKDPAVSRIVRGLIEDRKKPTIVDAGALALLQKHARSKGTDGEQDNENFEIGLRTDLDRSNRADEQRGTYSLRASATDTAPLILTPHEGEFLRLMAGTQATSLHEPELLKDRVAVVRDFATKHGVILVLKGERVLIGGPDGRVVVNPTGNSGLGKAGNGDTLAGILAGFVAQAARMQIDIFETVVAAVYVAGMAGDIAEQEFGKRVMTASDVRDCLTEVFAAMS